MTGREKIQFRLAYTGTVKRVEVLVNRRIVAVSIGKLNGFRLNLRLIKAVKSKIRVGIIATSKKGERIKREVVLIVDASRASS